MEDKLLMNKLFKEFNMAYFVYAVDNLPTDELLAIKVYNEYYCTLWHYSPLRPWIRL